MLWIARDARDYIVALQQFASQGVHLHPTRDLQIIGSCDAQHRLTALVAYDGFIGRTCQMHVVANSGQYWLNKMMLWAVFDYPFNQCGMVEVFACSAADNSAALKLTARLGFKDRLRSRDGWGPGVDLIVRSLRREECRWLALPKPKEFQNAQVKTSALH